MNDIKSQIQKQCGDIPFGIYKVKIDNDVVKFEGDDLLLFCTPTAMTVRTIKNSGKELENQFLDLIRKGISIDWDFNSVDRKQVIGLDFQEPKPEDITTITSSFLSQIDSKELNYRNILNEIKVNIEDLQHRDDELQAILTKLKQEFEQRKGESEKRKINIQANILNEYKERGIIDISLPDNAANPYKIVNNVVEYTKEISNKLNVMYDKIDAEDSKLQNDIRLYERDRKNILVQINEYETLYNQINRSIQRNENIRSLKDKILNKHQIIDFLVSDIDDFVPTWSKDLKELLQQTISDEEQLKAQLNTFNNLPSSKLLSIVTFGDRIFEFGDIDLSEANAELLTVLYLTGNIGIVNIDGDCNDTNLSKLKDTLNQIPNGKYYIKIDKQILKVPGVEGELQVKINPSGNLEYSILPAAKELTVDNLKGIPFKRGNTLLNDLLDLDSLNYIINHTVGTPNINIYINAVSDDDDVLRPFKIKLKEYAGNYFNIIINNKLLTIPNTNNHMQVLYKDSELIYINSKNKEEYKKGGAYLRTLLNQTNLDDLDLSLYGVKGKYKMYIDHTLKVIIITTDAVNNYVACYSNYRGSSGNNFSYKPINSNSDIKLTKSEVEHNIRVLATVLYERFRKHTLLFLVNKTWNKGVLKGTAVGRLLTVRHAFVPVLFQVQNIILPLKFEFYKEKFENSEIGKLFLDLAIRVTVADISMNFITLKEACILIGSRNYFKVNSLLLTDFLYYRVILNQMFETKYISELNYSVPGESYIVDEPTDGYYPVNGFVEYVYDNPAYKQNMQTIVSYLGLSGGGR